MDRFCKSSQKLTHEEEAKAYEAFSAFDQEKKGTIYVAELKIMLEMLGNKTLENTDIDDLFPMGEVNFSGFLKIIQD